MQKISLDKFRSAGLLDAFLSALMRGIERGDVSIDYDGRLKTRATLRSIAGMMFLWNNREVSIAGLLAAKNGYSGDKLCLRGSDFVSVGADFVEEILSETNPYILPVSKAKPKVSSDNLGDSADVLSACGL